MVRRLSVALILGLVIAAPSWGVGEKKALVLKVLVPEEDATISVNGKTVEGEGKERKIEVTSKPKGKNKDHVITASWEPNNYTKFTRTRKVKVDATGEVTVD